MSRPKIELVCDVEQELKDLMARHPGIYFVLVAMKEHGEGLLTRVACTHVETIPIAVLSLQDQAQSGTLRGENDEKSTKH